MKFTRKPPTEPRRQLMKFSRCLPKEPGVYFYLQDTGHSFLYQVYYLDGEAAGRLVYEQIGAGGWEYLRTLAGQGAWCPAELIKWVTE